MIFNDKYVVMKRKEVEHMNSNFSKFENDAAEYGSAPGPLINVLTESGLILPDAVVIRCQDKFATSGLYGYANGIQLGLELLDDSDSLRKPVHANRRRDLEASRDYFLDCAREAEAILQSGYAKYPDH